MYAAVFVRDPSAHVSLSAQVYPDKPSTDSLAVTVTGASPKLAGWLLIIECPARPLSQAGVVRLSSETVPQTQTVVTQVRVYSGLTDPNPRSPFLFSCFTSAGGVSGVRGYAQSLSNVSLPALQFDQDIVGAQAAPVLYAQQDNPGGPVGQLIQLFPSATCPSPAPSPTLATASPGASPGASGNPGNPSCSAQVPAGKQFIQYELPTAVTTTETLNHVDTNGYQISEYPVGNMVDETAGDNTEESIQWTGQSGLSPSLDAVNQAAEAAASHDSFMAGVFFGIASGTAVGFVDQLWENLGKKRRRPRGGDPAGGPGPEHQAGTAARHD